MKKFLLIFTAITLLFLVIGAVSFGVNDRDKFTQAINSEYGDEHETIWKYPIYDRIYEFNKYLNDMNSQMHEIKDNMIESFR